MHYTTLFFVPLSVVTLARAANDWSTPCFQGECSYDLPASANSASGTVKIWGSPNAITDVTTAAGWMILSCSPDALSQDIRIVCQGDAASCGHLSQGSGAAGKIVRLPENCGKSAFARIANMYIPADQSMPAQVAARFVRRDGVTPQVKALTLDTDFGAASPQAGDVNIAIQGTNLPGFNSELAPMPTTRRRRSHIEARNFIDNALGALSDKININKTANLKPIDINKQFQLLNKQLNCGAIKGSIVIDADTKAHATANIGIVASGTIIPPKIDDFGIFAGLTANLNGDLNLNSTLAGSVDTGSLKIIEVGVPGLNFPGILSVGPTLKVNAQAKADLDTDVDAAVGLSFNIDNAQLFFPPKKGQNSGGVFKIGDTPLKLSASPNGNAKGSVEAHIIPSLNLGIDALGGAGSATVFLNLDASASLDLSFDGNADFSLQKGGSSSSSSNSTSGVISNSTATASSKTSTKSAHTSMSTQGMSKSSNAKSASKSMSTQSMSKSSNAKSASKSMSTQSMSKSSNAKSASKSMSTQGMSKSSNTTVDNSSDASKGMSKSSNTAADSPSNAGKGMTKTSNTTAGNTSNAKKGMMKEISSSGSSTSSAPSEKSTDSVKVVMNEKYGQVSAVLRSENGKRAVTGGVNGCVDLKAALNVNAGAQGSFFNLFNKNTAVTLFNKQFQILKKCFGNSASAKQKRMSRMLRLPLNRRAGLVCPATGTAAPVAIADQTVNAADIAAL